MDIRDRIEFRKLQAIFFAGMVEYPNDKERMEKMYSIFEKFIDSVIEREISKVFGRNATIKYGDAIKGGGGSAGGIIH